MLRTSRRVHGCIIVSVIRPVTLTTSAQPAPGLPPDRAPDAAQGRRGEGSCAMTTARPPPGVWSRPSYWPTSPQSRPAQTAAAAIDSAACQWAELRSEAQGRSPSSPARNAPPCSCRSTGTSRTDPPSAWPSPAVRRRTPPPASAHSSSAPAVPATPASTGSGPGWIGSATARGPLRHRQLRPSRDRPQQPDRLLGPAAREAAVAADHQPGGIRADDPLQPRTGEGLPRQHRTLVRPRRHPPDRAGRRRDPRGAGRVEADLPRQLVRDVARPAVRRAVPASPARSRSGERLRPRRHDDRRLARHAGRDGPGLVRPSS